MARKPPEEAYDSEEDDGRSGPQPMDWAVLFLRSALRRKVLFLSVLVMCCAGVFGYYKWKRPMYQVEAKIFAQRTSIVPASVRPATDDAPTRTAWELIHRRENLIALVKAASLLEAAPPENVRDRLSLRQNRDDPLDRMVKILDKMLVVIPEEGTITVSLTWPDPQQAYRVVDAALQNFIEARHVQEVTAIDEIISVLRARAAKAKEQLDLVTDQVRRESAEGYRESVAVTPRPTALPRGPSEELVRIKSMLDAKVRAIEDVEEFRRRRLADLHAQLDEKRNTYSDAHPAVLQLKQDIEALTKESSQVLGLRAEEIQLRQQYQARLDKEGISESAAAAAAGQPSVGHGTVVRPPRAAQTPVEDDERVRDARFQYQQIVERVNGAQLELDAVRAAFKYRYNVIWPPQVPTDPISPNPVKIFGAGLLAALFFAFVAAAAPDLRSGRIVERWQVERGLELPILGEVTRK